jgi:hypothetical protein
MQILCMITWLHSGTTTYMEALKHGLSLLEDDVVADSAVGRSPTFGALEGYFAGTLVAMALERLSSTKATRYGEKTPRICQNSVG